MSLLLTPVVGLVSLRYWRIHLVALAVARCACSFQLSCASTCTPRYLKLVTSCIYWPSIQRMGLSSNILFCASSGLTWVLRVACRTTNLLTSNLELWSLLHSKPPSSFVIIWRSHQLVLSKFLPVAISMMSSTYPRDFLCSSFPEISSRSALYMMYRIMDRGSP